MLHDIKCEIPPYPFLDERIKEGIIRFLRYWRGIHPVIIVRNPQPYYDSGMGQTYGVYYRVHGGSSYDPFTQVASWSNESVVGTPLPFDWNNIYVVNSVEDISTVILDKENRYDY